MRQHFYPRPPRGGRPAVGTLTDRRTSFLSTPSARRATLFRPVVKKRRIKFLTPPAAWWATPVRADLGVGDQNFYPRPPRGGRRGRGSASRWRSYFYPRPPRGGRQRTFFTRLTTRVFLSTPSARRATAKTERKHPAFVSLYTSLHKLQRDVCKPNRKITPLLAQTAGIPVRSVPENYVCCRFALAGHQKISTLSWANSGCSPTCSTLVW